LKEAADGRPEGVVGSGRGLAQERLELGEELLLRQQLKLRKRSADILWKPKKDIKVACQATSDEVTPGAPTLAAGGGWRITSGGKS
jgi:hypothetical protein